MTLILPHGYAKGEILFNLGIVIWRKTITNKEKNPTKGRQRQFFLFTSAILILSTLIGCGPSTEDLEAVDNTPLAGDDWTVSTLAEQGLDPPLFL